MASGIGDALGMGFISGFTTSLDQSNQGFGVKDVADSATGVQNTRNGAEDDGSIIGPNSGVRYGQLDNSRYSQLQLMLAHTAYSYAVGGKSINDAMMDGSKAVQDHDNMAWRASEAARLDEEGYDPHGIKAWIRSGDNKDLVTGAGQMIIKDPNTGKNIRVDAIDAQKMMLEQKKADQPNIFGSAEGGYFQQDKDGHITPIVEGVTKPKEHNGTFQGSDKRQYQYEYDDQGNIVGSHPVAGQPEAGAGSYGTVTLKDGQTVDAPGVYTIDNGDGTSSHVNVGISARGNLTVKPFTEKEEGATQENKNRFADFTATSNTMIERGQELAKSGKLHASGSGWSDKAYQETHPGATAENESSINQYNEALGKAVVPVMLKTVGSQRAFASEFDGLGGSAFEKLDPKVSSEENHARIKRNEKRISVYKDMMNGLQKGEHGTLNVPGQGGKAEGNSQPIGTTSKADGSYNMNGKTVVVRNGLVYPS